MDALTSDEIFYLFFKGKHPIPTDSIRQQNEVIVEDYIRAMQNGDKITPIEIATEDNSHVGEEVFIKDAIASEEKIFIVNGHHRYNASLATGYPLKAIFVKPVVLDHQKNSTLCDYLDAYEYWQNR